MGKTYIDVVKYMVEAKFAQEDEKKKEEVDVLNQADTLVYATEKSLKEFGEKVGQSERADIEARINDLKQAMKDKNIDSIKRGTEELMKVSHKLAEEIYKKTAEAQKGPGAGSQGEGPAPEAQGQPEEAQGNKKNDDVIDAEYTTDDDKKKGKK